MHGNVKQTINKNATRPGVSNPVMPLKSEFYTGV